MEGANLLYVPHRQTSAIPLAQTLKDVITEEFYQSPSAFAKDLSELEKLRNSMMEAIEIPPADALHALALLKQYYCQVCYIEKKFPKDAIEFTWYSNNLTYKANHKISLRSFAFEKINVLYNMASVCSHFAFCQNRTDLESLQKSSLYFQFAAGYLSYLSTYLSNVKDFQTPIEYSIESIHALEQLMLAQAQEAFWQRAISNSNDKIISILAQKVGEYYKDSYDSFNKSQFILRSEFLHHINCKSSHFFAAANYRMAQFEYVQAQYGEQVAHLRYAKALSSKALKSTRGVTEVVVDDLKGLDDAVAELLATAEKENNLIYHKDVPNNATPINGRSMVKVQDVRNELESPVLLLKETYKTTPFFESLLPYMVLQSAQAFKERQEEFVSSNLITPMRTLTNLLETFINERDLPASLDSITKPQRLPETLMQHCQDLLSNDTLSKLRSSLNELSKRSDDSAQLIEACKERLVIEEQENQEFKERQGSARWRRQSSKDASKELRDKIAHYENFLVQAASGDATIKTNVDEITPYLELMTRAAIPGTDGRDKLKKFIPMSDLVELSPETNKVIKQLKEVLNNAASDINKRQQFIEAVEIKSRELSILPKVISEYRLIQSREDFVLDESTFEPVYSKHLKDFDSDLKHVYKVRDAQTALEAKIDSFNKKFIEATSRSADASEARTEALKTLNEAFKGAKENLENIQEGYKFYNNFIENVEKLMKECDNFVYQRRIEAQDLERKLNQPATQAKAPQTPSRPMVAEPPSSIMAKNHKSTFSDDEVDESFHSVADDSIENILSAQTDGSKSPLKAKRTNNGKRVTTKLPETPEMRKTKDKSNTGFWDPSQGIKFG